jgi:dTDP-glucose 4,6-dehydratase
MSILVTGGAGFIGSSLLRQLKVDEEIICIDKITYAGNKSNVPLYVKLYEVDLWHEDSVRHVFEKEKITSIFHLAAETHVDNSIKNCKPFIESNIIGTVNLLQCALENEVEKFMHISTDEVFGSIEEGSFFEGSRYIPRNPYSASKASSDHFVYAYNKTYGLPTIITNCSNNYGPRQFGEKLIPTIINNIKNDSPIPVYGDGQNVRDWIYVEDHCDALINLHKNGKLGERYNIGGECELTNLELIQKITNLMGKPEHPINFITDRLGHDRRYSTSNDKICSETDWKPTTDITEGLRKTIEYYENH